MRSRLEERFQQARQQAESPIAYSGLSLFTLHDLREVSMPLTREVLEALIRCRARLSHTDVVAGREEEIRSLSPYFTLMKDVKQLDRTVMLHLKEREGLLREYGDARESIQDSRCEISDLSAQFSKLHGPGCEAHIPFRRGEVTLFVLPQRELQKLIHDPSPSELRESGVAKEVTSVDDIPEKDRSRLQGEAYEKYASEIELVASVYADTQMEKKHPKLTKTARDLAGKERFTAAEKKVLSEYDKLHDSFFKKAPLDKKLSARIQDYMLEKYLHDYEGNFSEERREAEIRREFEDEQAVQDQSARQSDMNLLLPRMQRVELSDGRTTAFGKAERTVVGVLPLSDTQRMEPLFKAATSSSGCEPTQLLPWVSNLGFDLPEEYRVVDEPTMYPSASLYLVTAEYKAGDIYRVYIEGQVFGVMQRAD